MADTSSQKGNHIETLLSKKILMMRGNTSPVTINARVSI